MVIKGTGDRAFCAGGDVRGEQLINCLLERTKYTNMYINVAESVKMSSYKLFQLLLKLVRRVMTLQSCSSRKNTC